MLALKYKIIISDGAIARAHGMGSGIEEIFIPDLGITFNISRGELNVFKEERTPAVCKTSEVSASLAHNLKRLLEDRVFLYEEAKRVLEKENVDG